MAKPGIIVDGVWKRFHRGEMYDSLRDLIPSLTNRLFGRGLKRDELRAREFWALRDISFEVGPGESLGIIGANGAGKSTLLKVLNRVLAPSLGRVQVRGKVGALIEIAAGFHPDLTGRENVFLQGAIMGMRREQIERQFDAIVAFSGVEAFIDTPIKRYSSGMNARLGFAIAVHLEPDVLVIDEVLSVGDMEFQQRAFAKLRTLRERDIPVVVVSHQLKRIEELCDRVILLDHGRMVAAGSPEECISTYVRGQLPRASSGDSGGRFKILRLFLDGSEGVRSGGAVTADLEIQVTDGQQNALQFPGLRLRSTSSGEVVSSFGAGAAALLIPESGHFELSVTFQVNIPSGTYVVESYVHDPTTESTSSSGPTVVLHVDPGYPFYGPVQLNPKWRVGGSLSVPQNTAIESDGEGS